MDDGQRSPSALPMRVCYKCHCRWRQVHIQRGQPVPVLLRQMRASQPQHCGAQNRGSAALPEVRGRRVAPVWNAPGIYSIVTNTLCFQLARHKRRWPTYYQPAPAVRDSRMALQWDAWEANELDNHCPACKKMTLVFDPVSVMFD